MHLEEDVDDVAWGELVRRSSHATMFVTSEWLACFGDRFQRSAAIDANGRYIAGFVAQREGATIGNVGITPYQGLVVPVTPAGALAPAERAAADCLAGEIVKDGVRGRIRCQPGLLDLKPLVWAGAQLSLRLTHQLAPMPPERCWDQLAPQVRGHVRRGERHGLTRVRTGDVEPLRELVVATFSPWFDVDAEFAGLAQAVRRGLVSVEMALDRGEVQGAIAICHGAETDHYLLSGRRRGAVSGVIPWLIWSSLRTAMSQGRSFDFEGSMLPGVSQFYDQFRGTLTPVAELVIA